MFQRVREQLGFARWVVESRSARGAVGAKGGRGGGGSASGVLRVGDVPLCTAEPEPEPLSPAAEGTPPAPPPTRVEAKGYYDMLSNKSSRISQLIVYIEVS